MAMPIARLSLLLLSCIAFSVAIPTWENFSSRSSIGSLVPGASFIEAMGSARTDQWHSPNYLTIRQSGGDRGTPGNATIGQTNSPPLFFINKEQLYQFTNATHILPVNVYNSTAVRGGLPLRLATGDKLEGIGGGSWRWKGTMLYYDYGAKSNNGLFYLCQYRTAPGVYMNLDPAPTPPGCNIVTLHSFNSMRGD
ncbi:hypothetical protein PLICRDRAFT_34039 [Plicaturopsis crispa FD-325 SS-3]|nr:hypothetical protein PLICRDRAFT_34039 [Plicaturopsis crispa FD-325 SS-3]